MSVLQTIESQESKNPLVNRVLPACQEILTNGKFIKFCWIPSHRDITGNEHADRAAKDALSKAQPTHFELPCLCSWGYSHQSGAELLPAHGPGPPWCGSLLWLNVLFASNWGWRHREPFYLPYHEPALVIEWQGHTCSFLLGTKPLWHWRKWKSGPTS